MARAPEKRPPSAPCPVLHSAGRSVSSGSEPKDREPPRPSCSKPSVLGNRLCVAEAAIGPHHVRAAIETESVTQTEPIHPATRRLSNRCAQYVSVYSEDGGHWSTSDGATPVELHARRKRNWRKKSRRFCSSASGLRLSTGDHGIVALVRQCRRRASTPSCTTSPRP